MRPYKYRKLTKGKTVRIKILQKLYKSIWIDQEAIRSHKVHYLDDLLGAYVAMHVSQVTKSYQIPPHMPLCKRTVTEPKEEPRNLTKINEKDK